MESLTTTIRKMLNEGIGYAEDQGYGGYARPVYGGNNNQGAFRRMSGPPNLPPDFPPSPPRPDPRPEPTPSPFPSPLPPGSPQYRRIGMGDRRSQPTDYKGGIPPIIDPYYNSNQYRRIGMGDRRSQPTDYNGRYIPPTVDPYSGYQTRSLPMGGRSEPTDFGGYANPYG